MIFKSAEEIETFIVQYEELQRALEPIANILIELENFKSRIDWDDIKIEENQTYAYFEEYEGCGNYQEHSLLIPFEYLFDKEWKELAKKKIEEKVMKRLKEEEEKCKETEQRRLTQEYKMFLQLKEKFKND